MADEERPDHVLAVAGYLTAREVPGVFEVRVLRRQHDVTHEGNLGVEIARAVDDADHRDFGTSSSSALRDLDAAVASGLPAGVARPTEMLLPESGVAGAMQHLAAVPGVAAALAPADDGWRAGGQALVQIWSEAAPATNAGKATLGRVRALATGGDLGASARVGGTPAEDADFVTAVYSNAV